jgi:hypothetical protein
VVPRGLTAGDIFNRAEKRAETSGISLDWALSEVFKESRLPGKPQDVANQRYSAIQREASINE